MPSRGGKRTGTPGVAYANRSDLTGQKLPIATQPGAPYGESAQLSQAQRAVPMGGTPAPAQPAPQQTQPQQQQGQPADLTQILGGLRSLTAPSRTTTPATANLNQPTTAPDALSQLRAIYLQYPTEALRQLIQFNSTGNA